MRYSMRQGLISIYSLFAMCGLTAMHYRINANSDIITQLRKSYNEIFLFA